MRAWPLNACRHAASRSPSDRAECSTAIGVSNRSRNRPTSCGVRPISGTSTKARRPCWSTRLHQAQVHLGLAAACDAVKDEGAEVSNAAPTASTAAFCSSRRIGPGRPDGKSRFAAASEPPQREPTRASPAPSRRLPPLGSASSRVVAETPTMADCPPPCRAATPCRPAQPHPPPPPNIPTTPAASPPAAARPACPRLPPVGRHAPPLFARLGRRPHPHGLRQSGRKYLPNRMVVVLRCPPQQRQRRRIEHRPRVQHLRMGLSFSTGRSDEAAASMTMPTSLAGQTAPAPACPARSGTTGAAVAATSPKRVDSGGK
jgi:hypothetical protein